MNHKGKKTEDLSIVEEVVAKTSSIKSSLSDERVTQKVAANDDSIEL